MKKVFSIFKKNKLDLVKAIFIDFVFFVSFIILTLLFSEKIYQKFETLNNTVSNVFTDGGALPSDILNQLSNVSGILNEMLKLVLLYSFFIFLIWGLFQCIMWLISKNIIERKNIFNKFDLDYVLDFYLLNLIWFVILGILVYLIYNFFTLEINVLFLIVPFGILFYFWNISLGIFVLNNGVISSFINCFKFGFKKISLIFPFIFLIIFTLLIGFFSNLINNPLISILLLFLFLLGILVFRIYLLILVKEYAGDRI